MHSLLSFYTLLYELKKLQKEIYQLVAVIFDTFDLSGGLWQKFDCQYNVPSKSTKVKFSRVPKMKIYTANVLSAEFTDECLQTKSKDN